MKIKILSICFFLLFSYSTNSEEESNAKRLSPWPTESSFLNSSQAKRNACTQALPAGDRDNNDTTKCREDSCKSALSEFKEAYNKNILALREICTALLTGQEGASFPKNLPQCEGQVKKCEERWERINQAIKDKKNENENSKIFKDRDFKKWKKEFLRKLSAEQKESFESSPLKFLGPWIKYDKKHYGKGQCKNLFGKAPDGTSISLTEEEEKQYQKKKKDTEKRIDEYNDKIEKAKEKHEDKTGEIEDKISDLSIKLGGGILKEAEKAISQAKSEGEKKILEDFLKEIKDISKAERQMQEKYEKETEDLEMQIAQIKDNCLAAAHRELKERRRRILSLSYEQRVSRGRKSLSQWVRQGASKQSYKQKQVKFIYRDCIKRQKNTYELLNKRLANLEPKFLKDKAIIERRKVDAQLNRHKAEENLRNEIEGIKNYANKEHQEAAQKLAKETAKLAAHKGKFDSLLKSINNLTKDVPIVGRAVSKVSFEHPASDLIIERNMLRLGLEEAEDAYDFLKKLSKEPFIKISDLKDHLRDYRRTRADLNTVRCERGLPRSDRTPREQSDGTVQ